ncbi:unnamed protein product [Didymodactylos carnosus]|uniref:Uncharacterized protein n=1 Tax=Didymodactylos carnosus TaxID=1234261 RepID=A0A814P061_9BILA|nr:unnamed protein product [Didymodactylos carnosus]CAF1100957.1 unnamed protein product [Didymodactylos carnosus]CAF3821886.1 unnamed protein product [Didymodactylos carnosus]CAF3865873.1 unnamed protein product [Didymodactylos carnosus]
MSSRLQHSPSNSSYTDSPSLSANNSENDTVLIAKKMSNVSLEEREGRQQALDRLELSKTVGTGSYGRVLLVRDRETSVYHALKIFSITHVVQSRQTEHVKSEKEILAAIKHPFIVKLHWTHHSEQFLYMLLDYLPGGELFTYMRRKGSFDLKTSIFYAAEITSALEYLHSLQIVYRDLKPENILLDAEGHVKIVDFGFAKKIMNKTFTTCGTPDYLSPELFKGTGHNKSTDWWSLGILTFEMLSGATPFNPNQNESEIPGKVLSGKISWPRTIDESTKAFIKKLLHQNPDKRLGAGRNGSKEVKEQPWFSSIKWDDVYHRKLKPPIVPDVKHPGDTTNFDEYKEDWRSTPFASDRQLELFQDF